MTDEILARLKTMSLIYPPWTRPSYRYILVITIVSGISIGIKCCTIFRVVELITTFIILSNVAFGLLGRCMAQYIDPQMTYEEYVQKNMLGPLEMKNTGFNITSRYAGCIVC